MGGEGLGERLGAPRIAVLGQPSVGTGGALRPLRGHPARLLVALVTARLPCTVDALADLVWGDSPPSTFRSALHVHLGSLRKALASTAPGASVVRSDAGYHLALDGWELDTDLAADLVESARRSLAADPAGALAALGSAIGLWRGVPFSVDGTIVDDASSQQAEALRRDAEDLRVEALLAAGDSGRAEQAALAGVESEPLREARWGQLLRARYLAGRTADALATYQQARATLVEALGIEPGRELHDLEAAVLTHDAARLRLPAPTEDPLPGPPAPSGPFVGRDAEIDRVVSMLGGRGRVAVLGPPGVGKTALAAEVTGRFDRNEVAWIDVRGDAPGSAAAALGHVVEWVRRHPDALVVLDDADAEPDGVARAVTDIARRAPGVRLLVTSRVPVGDLSVLVLAPLEVPAAAADDGAIEATAAVRFLRAALRELAPAASVAPSEAARLCRRAGGLPLALRLTAAAARTLPPEVLAAQPPSLPDDAVDRATAAVVTTLAAPVRQAFADLSVLEGDFDLDLAAGVAGVDPGRFAGVVADLVDHGLVQAQTERLHPYSFLDPLRAVGERQLEASGRRVEALDRLATACLHRARALHLASAGEPPVGLARRLESDLPRYRQALAHLASTGDAERALSLVCRLELPLYVLGWWVEKVELFDVALAIPGPPSPMRARAHAFRARPGPMHQIDLGHAQRAEAMAAGIDEPLLAAFARLMQAIALWWSGRPAEAVRLADDAATVFADSGRRFEWCEARKFLGVALVLDGRGAEGLAVQHGALEVVRRELASPFHVAHNLAYLGHCHRHLGDDTAALADWSEAEELCRQVGNRGTAIHIDVGLAEIALDHGDHRAGLSHARAAIELVVASRSWTYAPWAWTVALRAHLAAGDLGAAAACGRRAAATLVHTPPGEAVRLAVELAGLALELGDDVAAARLLGVASATPDVRELPFPSPTERARHALVERAVVDALGPAWHEHADAGRSCTVVEAAGEVLAAVVDDHRSRASGGRPRPGPARRRRGQSVAQRWRTA